MSFLFGSKQSTASIPGWLEDAATEMLDRSVSLGKTGYMPYAGPEVAALTPRQHGVRESQNRLRAAYGMNTSELGAPGATDFGNGIWGYSSLPGYERQMDYMRENRPGQLDYYQGHFIDPVTGAPSAYDQAQAAQMQPQQPMFSPYRDSDDGSNGRDMNGFQGSPGGNPFGGYTGLGDMFNGGGPGASGPTYQGGGLISDIGNARNAVTGRSANDSLFGGWF